MNKLLIYVVIAAVVVGGIWYFSSRSGQSGYQVPTASPSPTATPSPTPTVSVRPSATPTKTPTPSGTLIIHESKVFRATIQGFAFSPSSVTVKRGDVVIFSNMDSTTHTVTSAIGAFDSGPIGSGAQWTLATANLAPGTYGYHCAIHPSMQGTVIVQ